MVEFRVKHKASENIKKYEKEKYDIALEFAKQIYKEFGTFLRAIVLFGSVVRSEKTRGDIDVLLIVDDVTIDITPEVIDTYRIITERTVRKVSDRLHVITLRFTNFWEYIRAADPVSINILRDGVALIDSGFFTPLQILLWQGKIRPTAESVHNYFVKAPATLHNSKWHIMQATIDLYWAVIDAAHAALMHMGEVPPSPAHVADLMQEKMIPKKICTTHEVNVMKEMYKLNKMIGHREIKEITGEQYDKYLHEAEAFVQKMKEFLDKKYVP